MKSTGIVIRVGNEEGDDQESVLAPQFIQLSTDTVKAGSPVLEFANNAIWQQFIAQKRVEGFSAEHRRVIRALAVGSVMSVTLLTSLYASSSFFLDILHTTPHTTEGTGAAFGCLIGSIGLTGRFGQKVDNFLSFDPYERGLQSARIASRARDFAQTYPVLSVPEPTSVFTSEKIERHDPPKRPGGGRVLC